MLESRIFSSALRKYLGRTLHFVWKLYIEDGVKRTGRPLELDMIISYSAYGPELFII